MSVDRQLVKLVTCSRPKIAKDCLNIHLRFIFWIRLVLSLFKNNDGPFGRSLLLSADIFQLFHPRKCGCVQLRQKQVENVENVEIVVHGVSLEVGYWLVYQKVVATLW